MPNEIEPIPATQDGGQAQKGGNQPSPWPEASPLTTERRILRSFRRLSRSFEVSSRQLAVRYGVTGPQLDCLAALADGGPLTITLLARQLVLSPSTVVGIIDRLERKGLATRLRDSRDRRVVRISLTAEGLRLAASAESPLRKLLGRALRELSAEEQAALTDVLERLAEKLEGSPPEATPPDLPITEIPVELSR